jgi:hypothetical protein
VASKQDEGSKGNAQEHPAGKLGNDDLGTEKDNVDRGEFSWIDHRAVERIIAGVDFDWHFLNPSVILRAGNAASALRGSWELTVLPNRDMDVSRRK